MRGPWLAVRPHGSSARMTNSKIQAVRWLRPHWLVMYVSAFVLITAVTFAMLVHSEPYEFAKDFVTLDERVLRVTGKPTNSRLRLTRAFRYAFGDRTGEAEFTFRSVTTGGTYDVRVQLAKQGGRWQVQRAEVRPESGEPTAIVGERN
jgi:hypothetical protein